MDSGASTLEIVPATREHEDGIWPIFHDVISPGDTYPYDPAMSREEAMDYWFTEKFHPYVALQDGQVVGTYLLKPNQPGLGSHVANVGYMVSKASRGMGIGSALCKHSIEKAKEHGFLSIQFNMVVSTNLKAIALWKRHGFEIIGRLPQVFRHSTEGLVDAFVMHRFV